MGKILAGWTCKNCYSNFSPIDLGLGGIQNSFGHKMVFLKFMQNKYLKTFTFLWWRYLSRFENLFLNLKHSFSKVIWKLLRKYLLHCRIFQQVSRPTCVFCGCTNESSWHLFRICNLFLRFYYRIFRWLWWDLAIPTKLFCLILIFYLIWKSQNFAIFSNKTMFVSFYFY